MSKIICGDLVFENNKYKFDFRDNILILLPDNLDDFNKWYFNHFKENKKYTNVNIEGITNDGKYICFIHIKLAEFGRGILQAFVPSYVICNSNSISPLPRCMDIEKIRFYGECVDRFYNPKRIIDYPDFYNNVKYEFSVDNNDKIVSYKINKDIFNFGVNWISPHSSNINEVLSVRSYLEIRFFTFKNIDQLIEYYLNIQKIFSFISNRKYVKFDRVVAYKNEDVKYGFKEVSNVQRTEFIFEFYFVDPDEEFDLGLLHRNICLEDLNSRFPKIYKEIIKDKFIIDYYPLNTIEDDMITNEKYLSVSSAFESEFDKLYSNFKSSTNNGYKEVKNSILRCLSNKRVYASKKLKDNSGEQKKYLEEIIKESNYFSKIIKKIDGTLNEKIDYSFKTYRDIIEARKKFLSENYTLANIKYGNLSKEFVRRRNDISHGNGTCPFNPYEIISYELLRICIFCVTLERCGFSMEEIKILASKRFWI